MTTYFISRHPGALEWAQRRGLSVDHALTHLDPQKVGAGDTVIGSLPVNLAAAVRAQGARFFNLSLELPADARGRELSADDMDAYGARLEEFLVERAP
ncbi:MAG TPA: CRISPR-associated protein Csx16 [Rhodocyclaceae bacterium]|nr:CRISPR-associated protein Csx16 [Rhodocyclaceae bacterium]